MKGTLLSQSGHCILNSDSFQTLYLFEHLEGNQIHWEANTHLLTRLNTLRRPFFLVRLQYLTKFALATLQVWLLCIAHLSGRCCRLQQKMGKATVIPASLYSTSVFVHIVGGGVLTFDMQRLSNPPSASQCVHKSKHVFFLAEYAYYHFWCQTDSLLPAENFMIEVEV